MVRMGKVTRSSSSALALIAVLGGVEAYAPPRKITRASIGTRLFPSFLVLPRQLQQQQQQQQQQQRCIAGTETMSYRCLPLFSAPGPDAPTPETKDSVVDSEQPTTSPSKAMPGDSDNSTDIVLKVAAALAAALVAYGIASLAITATTQFVTSLSASISSSFWGSIASFPDTLGAILAAIFGFLKFLVPALGKLGMSAYETASPIVSETSQRAIEAATPVLQETATKLGDVTAPYLEEASKAANEVAAPYVDQLNSAKGAVETQVQGATQAVTGAVEAQIQGATKVVGDAFDAQIQRIRP
jgi:hypothetical protein